MCHFALTATHKPPMTVICPQLWVTFRTHRKSLRPGTKIDNPCLFPFWEKNDFFSECSTFWEIWLDIFRTFSPVVRPSLPTVKSNRQSTVHHTHTHTHVRKGWSLTPEMHQTKLTLELLNLLTLSGKHMKQRKKTEPKRSELELSKY